MSGKLSAEETLKYLIGVIKENLDELYHILPNTEDKNFVHGEKTAYVECLEIMQYWERSEEHGLCGVIEKEYPL